MRRTKDEILFALRAFAKQRGLGTVTRKPFYSETGIKESDWRGHYWVTWNEVLAEAGLAPSEKTTRRSDDGIYDAIAACIKHFGKWPTPAAMRLYSRQVAPLPEYRTLQLRGDKHELARQIAAHLDGRPDYEEVRQICLQTANAAPRQATSANGSAIKGFVYMQKHEKGRYKIGRSDSPNRRVKEIGLKLPYNVENIHTIPSVAPSALERYWHIRFSDKHIDGEFYKLDAADVQAFKRRKEDV